MKTLILLLLVAAGLGGAFWKTQHPDATLDDIKLGAANTLDRAKSGFATFRSGAGTGGGAASTVAATAAGAAAVAVAAGSSATDNASNAASTAANIDATVVNGRLQDAERRLDASDQKLDVIESSVDALGEEIKTVSSSLGNLNDNVAGLSADLNEQDDEQTLTNIGTRVDTISAQLDELAASSEQNDGEALDAMGTRIDALSTQLNDINASNETTLASLGNDIAIVTEANEAMQGRLDTLSVDTSADGGAALSAQVDQRLQELETKLSTANSDKLRLNSLMARLNTTDQKIESLGVAQTDSAADSDQLAEFTAALNASTEKTEALEVQLNQANDKIASMSEELEALKNQSGSTSVETLQAELTQQLEELESRIANTNGNTANTDVSTLNATLSATRQRIQSLESRVQSLPTGDDNAAAAQAAQSSLQEQIAAMEARLGALPQQTDPELLNTLSQVQQDVAELRERETPNTIEYRVYFGNGSTGISDDAAVVLKSFIKQEQNRTTGVNIYGFTDRRGDAAFNQRLALRRATAVRSYLIQNGFDYTKIKFLTGLGEDAAATTLEDGVQDSDQRTVVLVADQP